MVLLLYLVIFLAASWLRHRYLTGRHLAFKMNGEGKVYFETLGRNAKARTVAPSLGLPLDIPFSFVISPERWHHRLLKALGLAEELETEDKELNRRLFFACDRPDCLGSLLQKSAFVSAVRTLFTEMEVKSLRAFNGKIWVDGRKVKEDLYTPAQASRHLRLLKAIADEFQMADLYHPAVGGRLTPSHKALLLMTGHAAFLTLGLLGGLPLLVETTEILRLPELIYISGVIGAGIAVFWLYLIFVLLGGKSWLPMVVADFMLMGLAGIFLSTAFVLHEANIHLDKASSAPHVQRVIAKQCTLKCSARSGKSRRSSSYGLSDYECRPEERASSLEDFRRRDYKCGRSHSFSYKLTVPPWNEEQIDNYSFPVPDTVYDAARIGDAFNIPVHPGAFGLAWVDTAEIRPAEQ